MFFCHQIPFFRDAGGSRGFSSGFSCNRATAAGVYAILQHATHRVKTNFKEKEAA
jgi:hypothetical protein